MINLPTFLRLYYFTAINSLLLWLQRVEKYYTSPNMPYICRTKRHFLGEPFCVAQWSHFMSIISFAFVFKGWLPLTFFILVFSYSLGQIFLPTARNTWSGLHHQKSLCDLGSLRSQWVPWSCSCLQTPWLSSKMKSWELNVHHIYECVDWPVTHGTITQAMKNMSFSFSEATLVTIWLWAVWSYSFLSFKPVNPCCLIPWRNILVILKEPRASKCCMQLLSIVSSLEIK